MLRQIVPNILHPMSQFGNGCGRFWRKSKFPRHHVPYMFNWREIWGLAGKGSLHHEEHVALQQPYVDVHCPAEKSHHLPVEEMAVAQG